ncbi:MAG TPA: PBP1A family penicillin-binding protein [Blastocatellia bacterium]|nr:PBP1A family penicillin-binding protein [Blastocatellia bacterium]
MNFETNDQDRLHTIITRLPVTRQSRFTCRKRIAAGLGLLIFFSALIAGFGLLNQYSRHAAFISERLADHSLLLSAGIYTAPRHIVVGRQMTCDELSEQLLRAGYLEGSGSDEFVSGSFTRLPDGFEIRTHQYLTSDELPQSIRISFAEKSGRCAITGIQNTRTQQRLEAVALPAEMLTADLSTRKQARRPVSFAELPPHLVKAITAIEDRRFFEHSGIDLKAMARALLRNWRSGEIREGGSTITQQFIKNQFLSPERSYERKLSEALMALALERRLTKQQILTLYCDRVYLGHRGITAIYGFKQAAQIYFGRDLSELSLSEAALLAGLVRAPNRYSPDAQPELARARRNVVLDAMVETGAISRAEAEAAEAEPLRVLPPEGIDDASAPYFVDYLRRDAGLQQFSESELAHLRIETTLDPDLQRAANQIVRAHLARLERTVSARSDGAHPEAALIALDPRTGEILAMVGGRDYLSSHFNRATDARRQPGSVFKPIVYAAALARGVSPTTTFQNAPQEFAYADKAVYRPRNFGNSYSGHPVMLRDAIVRSLNVVAVEAAMETGLGRVAELAEQAGLPHPGLYPSMALGAFEATPLDVARAYTVFASNGMRVDPLAIRAVRNGSGVLHEGAAARSSVVSPAVAWVVTDTLAEVVNRGTATRVRQMGYRGPAAGKTGTSRDAWFVGYTPKLLVVVWVGFDDHRDLKLTGGEAAVPIWTDFIKSALAVRPDLGADQFARPGGLEEVEVDADNGLLANAFCPNRRKMLLPSSLVPPACFQHTAPELPEPSPDVMNLLPQITLTDFNPDLYPLETDTEADHDGEQPQETDQPQNARRKGSSSPAKPPAIQD